MNRRSFFGFIPTIASLASIAADLAVGGSSDLETVGTGSPLCPECGHIMDCSKGGPGVLDYYALCANPTCG